MLNDTQRHLHGTRGQKEETDAQVAQIRNDPRPPSLCDVVTEELLAGRHPERPIVSRIAIVGEIASREEPVRSVFESLTSIVARRVNSEDPSGGLVRTKVVTQQQQASSPNEGGAAAAPATTTTIQTSVVSITGVCVEYSSHFIAVFESEPLHLVELIKELRGRLAKPATATSASGVTNAKAKSGSVDTTQQGSAATAASATSASSAAGHSTAGPHAATSNAMTLFSKVHIIYQVDDIVTRGTTMWTHIDASTLDPKSNAALNNNNALFSAVPLNDQVVKAIYNLIGLGVHAQGLTSKAMREHFSSGAVTTHPKMLPPQTFIEACIKSDLCLTVAEYISVFGTLPSVHRDKELLNPLEPPLQY